MSNKEVHIFGGGTVSHIRSHLALAAVAYGNTAKLLNLYCKEHSDKLDIHLFLTKMAGGLLGETNEDVKNTLDWSISHEATKIIFFNPALVDYSGSIVENNIETLSGKYEPRLKTREQTNVELRLRPTEKLAKSIRKTRKDIFLVTFKTTCGATEQEQYLAGLNMLKETSSNLVLANDTKTRLNMIITPEEASYHVTTDRNFVLKNLVEMAYLRSHLTFTRSTIIAGEPEPWDSVLVPSSLKKVVDYCIEKNAYKVFRGSTVGHFAVKLSPTTFLTSRRKTNFNDLSSVGLVKIETDGPDHVIAYGSKPSVGGQSQRIVFSEHSNLDCIVHFHCPIKKESKVPIVSQREYECGSHECGQNTSRGLAKFGDLEAVYLDNHGPNIVFNKNINPDEVIKFIENNFDLTAKTGGYLVE